ncbi:F-box protein CPR1-like [Papaver somniferum]|uniref:F-box protein CPR1-like n=1 Tax=Papaver somniferum TaxID=3469 RepID=UPI000E704FC5|nr:F-box protein CPR1-like [Papaver somniferum]
MEFPSNPKSPMLRQRGGALSTSKIPEELCHEILLRSPVKSVLKCKSVCKSWFFMISNPSFAKFHLQRNKTSNSSNNIRLLLGTGADLHSISYDSLVSSLSSESEEIEDSAVIRMPYPFRLDISRVALFGSCDGLVFLWLLDNADCFCPPENDVGYYTGCCGCRKDFLCIWNPATREYKKIPQSPDIDLHYSICICMNGVAYDGKNDDYKLVIGICCLKTDLTGQVQIFSLRSNSWLTIHTHYLFTYSNGPECGVLVNGNLHWLAKGECGLCIVYLDNISDLPPFKEIQLPIVPKLEFITAGVLEEGCLCVLADNGDSGLARVEVWEMQVYGVRESWIKRYAIANKTITTSFTNIGSSWKIMWSFRHGKIVFLDSFRAVLYDPKHGTAMEQYLDNLADFKSEVDFIESLVSLDSGTYWGQND